MKIQFHKNFKHHLLKNGFYLMDSYPHTQVFRKRFIKIEFSIKYKFVVVYYLSSIGQKIHIKGCKTLNDLYRLEKLIEGDTLK